MSVVGTVISASTVAAIVVGVVTWLAESGYGDVGGALVAIPFIDLIPLVFLSKRSDVYITSRSDAFGQFGSVIGTLSAFYLISQTALPVIVIVLVSLLTAFCVNFIVLFISSAA